MPGAARTSRAASIHGRFQVVVVCQLQYLFAGEARSWRLEPLGSFGSLGSLHAGYQLGALSLGGCLVAVLKSGIQVLKVELAFDLVESVRQIFELIVVLRRTGADADENNLEHILAVQFIVVEFTVDAESLLSPQDSTHCLGLLMSAWNTWPRGSFWRTALSPSRRASLQTSVMKR